MVSLGGLWWRWWFLRHWAAVKSCWGVGNEYLGTWWLSSRAFLEKRVRIIWGWNNVSTGGYLKSSSIALNHFWSMRLLVVNKY